MQEYGLKGDKYLAESLHYSLAVMEDLQHQLNNDTISKEDLAFLRFKKKTLNEYQKDRKWTCGKVCVGECDKTFNSKYDLLHHELGCFNIEKTGSSIQYKYIECSICGKKFYDKGQKLKPKYARNHHENSCRKTMIKRQKIFIKKALDDASNEQIKIIYNILKKKNELKFSEHFEYKKPRSPSPVPRSPSPVPRSPSPEQIQMEIVDLNNVDERPESATSVSTASSLDEWEYQSEQYWVDNKNRVYDRRDKLVGKRYLNDIENWQIEYEEKNEFLI